jgi:hypothetical protein
MTVKHGMLAIVALVGLFIATPAMATSFCGNRLDAGGPLGGGSLLTIVGLTADQQLVTFKECFPRGLTRIAHVSGLHSPDTALVGIDFRIQDGGLYGVGNAGGIYLLDPKTAVARHVSQLTIPLDGTIFGVDFNPAADRLRIISDSGQNLRHNVNAGGVTLMDTPLNYTAGTPASGLTGAAYTNNDLDPTTGTTLFDLDTSLNQVAIQSRDRPADRRSRHLRGVRPLHRSEERRGSTQSRLRLAGRRGGERLLSGECVDRASHPH